MQLGNSITKRKRDRFDRFKIIFPILLVGWIPSMPNAAAMVGKDSGASHWGEQPAASDEPVVSQVHQRLSDNRLVTDIVAAVRAPDRTLLGYVGDSVLVERIGKRLSEIDFSDRFVFEVLDQNGASLFANDFKPNPSVTSPQAGFLINEIRQNKSGHFEEHGNLYSF